jgi:hypothetical protein
VQERHSEFAFETVIEDHLQANGYVSVTRDGFDRDRAIFPELKERRSALIAAAVTGKIDIREDAA